MEVGAKDYVDDYMNLWKFKIWKFINEIGKKYDKLTIWDTPLFHVGANYDTIGNIISELI